MGMAVSKTRTNLSFTVHEVMIKHILFFIILGSVADLHLAQTGADPYLRAADLQNLPEPSIDTSLFPLNCSIRIEEWLPLGYSFAGHAASSATVVQDKLYVFSIPTDSHLFSKKDCVINSFNPVKDEWIRSKSHQIPIKGDLLLATSDGSRYVYVAMGGHSPFRRFNIGSVLHHIWRYDTVSNEWTDVPHVPQNNFMGGISSSGRYLHFIGAPSLSHDAAAECLHWRLDTSAVYAKWESVAPLPRCRSNYHVVSLKDRVYVLGGQLVNDEHVTEVNFVDRYDVASNTWDQMPAAPVQHSRADSSLAAIYDTLVLISTRPAEQFSHVIEYDTVADTWSPMVPLPRRLQHPVHFGLLRDVTWQGLRGDFIAVVGESDAGTPLAYMGRTVYASECKLRAKKNVHPPKGVCEVLPHQP